MRASLRPGERGGCSNFIVIDFWIPAPPKRGRGLAVRRNIMENATRRNRKTRKQGLTRAPAGKAHTRRSTPQTEQPGNPVGPEKANARRKTTLTNRKAERQAASQKRSGAKQAKASKALMPQRVVVRARRSRSKTKATQIKR